MRFMPTDDTHACHRRWQGSLFAAVALMAVVIAVMVVAPSSRMWDAFAAYLMFTALALMIYWLYLLAHLCTVLRLNVALWVGGVLVFSPLSVPVAHLMLSSRLKPYLASRRSA